MRLHPSLCRLTVAALCVLAACGNPAPAAATDSTGAAAVKVAVRPGTVYLERSEAGQHLNFDFLVENRSGRELFLVSMELFVFDAAGKLLRRDFVDGRSRMSLELGERRAVAAGDSALVFNPFHQFAPSLPLARLRYELAFETRNGKERHDAMVEVAPVAYETRTALVLPLKGRVLVREGHDYLSHHRRTDYTEERFRKIGWTSNFQRYAYDFVIVDERGSLYRGGRSDREGGRGLAKTDANAAHLSFGQPVYATGAGRVVDVHDGDPDDSRVNREELARRPTALGGNIVVIDHLNGEFSWFGHLKQGSVRVKAGQMVAQGDVIAEVGTSGDSMAPHLHYELRDGPGITGVEGLPSYFGGFRRAPGAETATRGQLDTGDIVENP